MSIHANVLPDIHSLHDIGKKCFPWK